MIQTKYLIIIGAVICLIILYYFYDEIKNVKKLFTPAYQKTMALEAKVLELEKTTNDLISQKRQKNKNDSPALSITYQSDMVKKNGNLSVKYADISETEAKELLKNIEKNKIKQPVVTQISQLPVSPTKIEGRRNQILNIQSEDLSDFNKMSIEPKKLQDEDTDTINFKISDLIKKKEADSDINEYQKILQVLSSKGQADEKFDSQIEVDEDVIKHISESIHYADLSSENILSDIPDKKKSSKHKKTPGRKNQK